MEQTAWFKRKFDFSYQENILPSTLERLDGTIHRLRHKTLDLSSDLLTAQHDGKWSILEHIGHLSDLEPLWQGRLEDILSGQEFLRPADLENNKTHQAGHNSRKLEDLLAEFESLRLATLTALRAISPEDVFRSSKHPRLKSDMRTMDLFLFVAEHDDHHLAAISSLIKQSEN